GGDGRRFNVAKAARETPPPALSSSAGDDAVDAGLHDRVVARPRALVDAPRDRASPIALAHQPRKQRAHELAAALAREEAPHRRNRRIVAVGDRQREPVEEHFVVADGVEAEGGFERGEARAW